MKTLILYMAVSTVFACTVDNAHTVAGNARSAIKVVVPSGEMTQFEKTARDELRIYIAKATGEKVDTVSEDAVEGIGRAIYLGRTRFAATNGID